MWTCGGGPGGPGMGAEFEGVDLNDILGEMFGAQSGLGYLLMTAIGLQNTQVIMAVTLLLVAFAATVSTALLAYERRLRSRY